MQAIVLVGGEGTRLRPLTETVPKPALALVDRPFLAYMVEWLAGHGVEEVDTRLRFLPEVLREGLGDRPGGARIRYVAEPQPLGTAGAIRYAADQLGAELERALLGAQWRRAHRPRPERAARGPRRAGRAGDHRPAPGLGCGRLRSGRSDDGGEVLEFLEKTGERAPRRDQRRDLRARALRLGADHARRAGLDRARRLSAACRRRPRLLALEGYWMDIGTPERYLQASWDILEGRVETRVEPSARGCFVDPGGGRRGSPRRPPGGDRRRLSAGSRSAGARVGPL